ncbi:YwqJ-related putative deaminase [Photorhabdus namnaonensis]|uniref:YwqJ-like deaminase n=1 Tax=Photorhabdus namnaonensis TaxID=1851568 RepID=A0A1B8YH08_9GAMM|nr:YwqJ-related putative deaminase [Photorhabdus namnaonensis]OCA54347.1 hypothetical protein Phpb_02791 [Photorhabdus namnaonensis]
MFKNDVCKKIRESRENKTSDETLLDALHLDIPDSQAVMSAYQNKTPKLSDFSAKTQLILNSSRQFGQQRSATKQRNFSVPGLKENGAPGGSFIYSKKSLDNFAAHAGYVHNDNYDDEFVNFKDNDRNLAEGKLFPGIKLFKHHKELIKKNGQGQTEIQPTDEPIAYIITDSKSFISGIKDMYEKAGSPLHPITEALIKEHMINNAGVLPTMAGIAGMHAEVQALNHLLTSNDKKQEKAIGSRKIGEYMRDMLESSIFTHRLTTRQAGDDFAACHNCSGILSAPVNVVTGKVESAGSNFSSTISKNYETKESPV